MQDTKANAAKHPKAAAQRAIKPVPKPKATPPRSARDDRSADDSSADDSSADDSVSVDGDVREQLTQRQQRVLQFIDGQTKKQGYPPTIREIGKHLGIRSTNGVNDHLNALQRKGYLRRQDHKSRTLSVVKGVGSACEDLVFSLASPGVTSANAAMPGLAHVTFAANDDLIDVPLLGRVAAGMPILAEENREDTVRVSSFLLGRGATQEKVFALRVVGESMIEDGIFDGDFLFVKKQPSARAGEIVVAMIDGEATVKRFFPEGDRIRFQPANQAMLPIYVNKSAFRQTDILGVVVGVYRRV